MFDVETQAVIDAYVLVCHPNQREKGNHIASPAWQEKLEPADHEHGRGDIVAETILAGKGIKELAAGVGASTTALVLTVLANFAEYLFVRDRPGNASDRNG